jgi:hypothetical protein
MRKSRFSDEQMVAILREADRTSVAEAANHVWAYDFVFDACAKVRFLSSSHPECV